MVKVNGDSGASIELMTSWVEKYNGVVRMQITEREPKKLKDRQVFIA